MGKSKGGEGRGDGPLLMEIPGSALEYCSDAAFHQLSSFSELRPQGPVQSQQQQHDISPAVTAYVHSLNCSRQGPNQDLFSGGVSGDETAMPDRVFGEGAAKPVKDIPWKQFLSQQQSA